MKRSSNDAGSESCTNPHLSQGDTYNIGCFALAYARACASAHHTIVSATICAPIVRSMCHNRRTAQAAASGRDKAAVKVRPLFSIVSVLFQPPRDKRDNGTSGTSGTRDKMSRQLATAIRSLDDLIKKPLRQMGPRMRQDGQGPLGTVDREPGT